MVAKFILENFHADGFVKSSYQSLEAHQNELSMFCCGIGLDLDERPFLPVEQPAFTVGLVFVSGVIRLLLPHQQFGEIAHWGETHSLERMRSLHRDW